MSQRKLQQDIDKVLKKVKDGVQEFDLIYNKFESIDPNENQSYKEKLEMDLKREIKKLQKHREQIKLWISKEDIKDKDQLANLLNSRKLIETKMELFKSIEKLMKIKQFSKVALSNPQLFIDPNDKIKNESCQFVVDCINELQKQLELLETNNNNNNNSSSSSSSSSNNTNPNDSDSVDSNISQDENESIQRHLYHINNLENILKLLQNDEMSSSKLNEYKDDILYYVENNNDPDFIEYDTLYQDMGCEVTSTTNFSIPNTNTNTTTTTTTVPATVSASNNTNHTNNTAASSNSNDKKKTITGTPKKKLLASSTTNASSQPVSSISNNNNNNTVTATPNASNDTNPNKKKDNTITNNKNTTEEPTLTFPKDRTDEIKEIMEKDIETNIKAFENKLFKDELKYWHNSKKKLLQPIDTMPQDLVSKLESSLLNCPDSLDADSPYLYRESLSLPHPTSVFFPNEPIRFMYPYDINENTNSTADGVTSHKNLNSMADLHHHVSITNNQGTTRHTNASNTIHTDGITISNTNNTNGATNIHSNNGSNIINGKNPTSQNKRYYNDIYSNTSLAKIFTKFDLDTLFFIFYHYQGSYEQFLAARELHKNRNWQFNKKDRCWYYKEIEKLPPGIISHSNTDVNKLEEESWRYFDYKKSWLARRCNSDFVYNEEDFEVL